MNLIEAIKEEFAIRKIRKERNIQAYKKYKCENGDTCGTCTRSEKQHSYSKIKCKITDKYKWHYNECDCESYKENKDYIIKK